MRIDEAVLIGLFCEGVLYGVFMITFAETLRALISKSGSFQTAKTLRRTFLAVTCSFFIVATLDLIINLVHALDAFVHHQGVGGASQYFANIAYWTNSPVTKSILIAIQILLGDSILIYRAYVLHNRKYYVALPLCILWLGIAVTGFAIPIEESLMKSDDPASIVAGRVNAWTNSATACELTLNVVGTILIAYPIWSASRRRPALLASSHGPSPQRRMHYALRIVIESALLYCAASAAILGCSIAHSNAQQIMLGVLVPLVGICFNLIIVRVNWHYERDLAPAAGPITAPALDTSASRLGGILGIPVHLAHLTQEK